MTYGRKFRLLLILVMIVAQTALSAQPAAAIRGAGFRVGNTDPIGLIPIVACPQGVEMEYVYPAKRKKFENLLGNFDTLKLTAAILMGTDPTTGITHVKPASQVLTLPLTFHPNRNVYDVNAHGEANAWYSANNAIMASASDRIAQSAMGNIRLHWSDFGLAPKIGDEILVVSRVPALGESLAVLEEAIDLSEYPLAPTSTTEYVNRIVRIEANCEHVFPPLSADCTYATIDAVGASLTVSGVPFSDENGFTGFRDVVSVSNARSAGLQSTLAEVVGFLSLEKIFPGGSTLADPVKVGELPPDRVSSISDHGYVFSLNSPPTSDFTTTVDYQQVDGVSTALPTGLLLYNSYESIEPHVNILYPTFRYVDRDYRSATETIYFYPLAADTDMKVTGIYVDKLDAGNVMTVTASAGSVMASRTTSNDGKVNLVELILDNVPKNTSQLDFTILSPAGTENGALLTSVLISYPCGAAPLANDDSASMPKAAVLHGTTVLANDSNPEGGSLTVETTPVIAPLHGSLILNADGTFIYTPNAEFVGTDSFVYRVSKSTGISARATVTITVHKLQASPASLNFAATVNEGNPEAQMLNIMGDPATTWKVSTVQTWLTLSPSVGTGSGSVFIQPNITNLTAGTHIAEILIEAGTESIIRQVTLILNSVGGVGDQRVYIPIVLLAE